MEFQGCIDKLQERDGEWVSIASDKADSSYYLDVLKADCTCTVAYSSVLYCTV